MAHGLIVEPEQYAELYGGSAQAILVPVREHFAGREFILFTQGDDGNIESDMSVYCYDVFILAERSSLAFFSDVLPRNAATLYKSHEYDSKMVALIAVSPLSRRLSIKHANSAPGSLFEFESTQEPQASRNLTRAPAQYDARLMSQVDLEDDMRVILAKHANREMDYEAAMAYATRIASECYKRGCLDSLAKYATDSDAEDIIRNASDAANPYDSYSVGLTAHEHEMLSMRAEPHTATDWFQWPLDNALNIKYPTRYFGSKLRLLGEILSVVPQNVTTGVDVFSGSGIVSYAFKKAGLNVVANDIFGFCAGVHRGILVPNEMALSAELLDTLITSAEAQMGTSDKQGFIFNTPYEFYDESTQSFIDAFRRTAREQDKTVYRQAMAVVVSTFMTYKGAIGFSYSADKVKQYMGVGNVLAGFQNMMRKKRGMYEKLVFAGREGQEVASVDGHYGTLYERIKSYPSVANGVTFAYFDPPYVDEKASSTIYRELCKIEGVYRGERVKFDGDMKWTRENWYEKLNECAALATKFNYAAFSYMRNSFCTVDEMRSVFAKYFKDVRVKQIKHRFSSRRVSTKSANDSATDLLFVMSNESGLDGPTLDASAYDFGQQYDASEWISNVDTILPEDATVEGSTAMDAGIAVDGDGVQFELTWRGRERGGERERYGIRLLASDNRRVDGLGSPRNTFPVSIGRSAGLKHLSGNLRVSFGINTDKFAELFITGSVLDGKYTLCRHSNGTVALQRSLSGPVVLNTQTAYLPDCAFSRSCLPELGARRAIPSELEWWQAGLTQRERDERHGTFIRVRARVTGEALNDDAEYDYFTVKHGDEYVTIIFEPAHNARWSRKRVNALPDAAFAWIEPGGEKDAQGRTTPRRLRHFPHHTEAVRTGMEHDTVDPPHLRSGLSYLHAADPTNRKMSTPHLKAHARAILKTYKEGRAHTFRIVSKHDPFSEHSGGSALMYQTSAKNALVGVLPAKNVEYHSSGRCQLHAIDDLARNVVLFQSDAQRSTLMEVRHYSHGDSACETSVESDAVYVERPTHAHPMEIVKNSDDAQSADDAFLIVRGILMHRGEAKGRVYTDDVLKAATLSPHLKRRTMPYINMMHNDGDWSRVGVLTRIYWDSNAAWTCPRTGGEYKGALMFEGLITGERAMDLLKAKRMYRVSSEVLNAVKVVRGLKHVRKTYVFGMALVDTPAFHSAQTTQFCTLTSCTTIPQTIG